MIHFSSSLAFLGVPVYSKTAGLCSQLSLAFSAFAVPLAGLHCPEGSNAFLRIATAICRRKSDEFNANGGIGESIGVGRKSAAPYHPVRVLLYCELSRN